MEPREPTLSPPEAMGRRISLGLYIGIVTVFTLICSVQIIVQAWARPPLALPVNCREQTQALLKALASAQTAARAGTNEQHSLELFRSTLGPTWSTKNTLESSCVGEPRLRELIEEVDQLRYAEEHAVRYDARELTQRRQRVSMLQKELRLDPVPH